MLQDPVVFPEPAEFRPERYLAEDRSLRVLERHEDPSVIGFGFGRRYDFRVHLPSCSLLTSALYSICPGMFFAMNSIFIGIASMLYLFNISQARDEKGEEVAPEMDFRGFIRSVHAPEPQAQILTYRNSHPVQFKCNIRPRSLEAAALIVQSTEQG